MASTKGLKMASKMDAETASKMARLLVFSSISTRGPKKPSKMESVAALGMSRQLASSSASTKGCRTVAEASPLGIKFGIDEGLKTASEMVAEGASKIARFKIGVDEGAQVAFEDGRRNGSEMACCLVSTNPASTKGMKTASKMAVETAQKMTRLLVLRYRTQAWFLVCSTRHGRAW
jgi:hypothetical protein